MAMPNLDVPLYPDVPNVAGVPPLFRSPDFPPTDDPGIDTSDGAAVSESSTPPVWGVFDSNGDKIAIADNVPAFGYDGTSRVSNAPMEQGGFAAYNKVQMPYDSHVRMTKGGALQDRSDFLEAIETAKQSTDLYSIVTPERTYLNANVADYNLRRETRSGATLLTVDLHIVEIRQAAAAQFSQTSTSSSSSTTGSGAPVAFSSSSTVSLPADQVQNDASADPVSLGQVQSLAPFAGQSTLFGPLSQVQ
ncbi:Dit-like phage tail protein N-terminal domain-containing protein [Pararobbsia alpina]|uniref:hypothetical protein n=1 Tax=Pararobbsia alpina TaxID=621374 RepID=UPI0039A666EA